MDREWEYFAISYLHIMIQYSIIWRWTWISYKCIVQTVGHLLKIKERSIIGELRVEENGLKQCSIKTRIKGKN